MNPLLVLLAACTGCDTTTTDSGATALDRSACDDPSLALDGPFSHTGKTATGTLVIDGTDCDAGATWEITL